MSEPPTVREARRNYARLPSRRLRNDRLLCCVLVVPVSMSRVLAIFNQEGRGLGWATDGRNQPTGKRRGHGVADLRHDRHGPGHDVIVRDGASGQGLQWRGVVSWLLCCKYTRFARFQYFA